jgi:DNA-binding NarL/FixJ family response regulator
VTVLDEAMAQEQRQNLRNVLSERELEVLEIATLGMTNSQIAKQLGVTVHTVKFHLASIYRKLGAANRTDAIVRSLRAGPLVAPGEDRI